jgi:glycosyltransferase involved in cell wall biosynthesis
MSKKITVLICCYNEERFLERALDSAFNQSLDSGEYEVLLIDDGSTDSSAEIATEHLNRPNFRYHRNGQNMGLVASCNKGLDLAEGTWVIRLDSDDAFALDMLSQMRQYTDDSECDLVYTDRKEIFLDETKERNVNLSGFNLFELIACGVGMRRQILQQIGGYRNLFWEEYDLYIRYLQYCKGKPVHIQRPLYYYSIYQGSMTSNPKNVEEGWKELIDEWGIDMLKQYGSHPRLS